MEETTMDDMQSAAVAQDRVFQLTEDDCFGPYINRSDEEVDGLLSVVREFLSRQGEYDQGDVATLEWDVAKDLLTVAEMLWQHRGYERALAGTSDAEG